MDFLLEQCIFRVRQDNSNNLVVEILLKKLTFFLPGCCRIHPDSHIYHAGLPGDILTHAGTHTLLPRNVRHPRNYINLFFCRSVSKNKVTTLSAHDAQLIHTVLLFYKNCKYLPFIFLSDILLLSLHYEIQENFLLHHSLNIPVIYPAVFGIHVYVIFWKN